MNIYDITKTMYSGMEIYPGDPQFQMTQLRSGISYIHALSFGTHTGTHIDAPSHYYSKALGIDSIKVERLISEAEVRTFGNNIRSKTAKAILYRSISEDDALSPSDAKSIVLDNISIVGTDLLSIGDDEVHKILLKAGVIIIEMLDLSNVPDGKYQMIALPLKIADADAAPARVILIDNHNSDLDIQL